MFLPGPASLITENRRLVLETGEPFGILSAGALESAVLRPWNQFLYDGVSDIPALANTLLFAIAEAHAFEQGNKRTAHLGMLDFLRGNGWRFDHPDDIRYAVHMKAVIAHRIAKTLFFAENILPFCRPSASHHSIAVFEITRTGKRLARRFGRFSER